MTTDHPITPPPELVHKWEDDILNERDNVDHVLDCAWKDGYRAGADAELEACCEWLGEAPVVYNDNGDLHPGSYLRDARRPKPPSLKERALDSWDRLRNEAWCQEIDIDLDIIRRALEQLND